MNPNKSLKPTLILLTLLLISLTIFPQTDTRYDSALNLPFNEKAGNINSQTGNLTLGAGDLSLPGRAGMGFSFSFGRAWNLNQSNTFAMSRNPGTGDNRLSSDTIDASNHMGAGWSGDVPYVLFNTSSGSEQMFLFLVGDAYQIDRNGIETGIDLLKSNLLDKRFNNYHNYDIV